VLKRIKQMLNTKEVKARKGSKHTCSVCSKKFTHRHEQTLVGMLGIIPVQFCKKCFHRVMAQSEELNLKDTQLKVV